ncbi:L,D-transpeptidase family protein [Lignipirellula cremea]|uniref:Uncharacterized protein n=1 Tax=Lignipirellula cremea TaxID=2528010 RepID=A0A518DN90_9BACT|nr:L,D-transpeptidase family protein [Lignipirellula cremea]QDU93302.1 hypothetical protein Pla8534_10820 [Lignipirellula cremea]
MNTFKTAAVVVLLLGVLYGVYVVLNQPEQDINEDPDYLAHGVPSMDIDTGQMVDPTQLTPFDPTSAFADASPAYPPQAAPASAFEDPSQPPAYGGSPSSSPSSMTPPDLVESSPYPTTHLADESPAQPPTQPPVQPPSTGAMASYTDAASPPSAYAPESGLMDATEPGSRPQDSHAAPGEPIKQHNLSLALSESRQLIDSGEFSEALARLTIYYHSPDLNKEEHNTLLEWLNLLATKVIYSQEHHLEEPYITQPGDNLETIARLYDVPPLLLYNINRDVIGDPTTLAPQTTLKVVRGPFYARVNISRRKLTLFVQQHFAGEFDVEIGQGPSPRPGQYYVINKLPKNDARNPYGQWNLQISGDGMAIHGASPTAPPENGCIGLTPSDAEDVQGILSRNSKVEILR